MKRYCWTASYNQAAIRNAGKRRDSFFDLASVAHIDGAYLCATRLRHTLDRGELARPGCNAWVAEHCDMCDARRNLLEELKPFTGDRIFKIGEAGRVAPGVSQAVDVTGTDWICDNREHDGNCPRCLQQRRKRIARLAENDVWSERYQFCDDSA
jgi:hypothetical protein